MPEEVQQRQLSDELVSLIHHVELHRSGWWGRALDRLVIVSVWLNQPAMLPQVIAYLDGGMDHRIFSAQIEAVVEQEVASGALIRLPSGTLTVSEEYAASLSAELDANRATETDLKERLATIAQSLGIEVPTDELWADMEALFITPLVRDYGARLYDLVKSNAALDADHPQYIDNIAEISEKYGPNITAVILAFLDPRDHQVRAYVLRQLNAGLFREAVGLDQKVLEALSKSRPGAGNIRIIIDTNFLFSLLGFHDNPGNQTAKDLLELVRTLSGTIEIGLYVLPITLDEARRTLRDSITRFAEIRTSQNIASAASQTRSAGLLTAYLASASKSGGVRVSPAEFFGPYEANLVAILEDKGVKVLNADCDPTCQD
jgi:hypothetical protein